MKPKDEIKAIRSLMNEMDVRLDELEVGLEEKPELPYQAELDVLLRVYSYEVVVATCDELKLAFGGHYTLEFLKGGTLTISALDHATVFAHRERERLEDLSRAFTSCGDC